MILDQIILVFFQYEWKLIYCRNEFLKDCVCNENLTRGISYPGNSALIMKKSRVVYC